MCLLSKAILHVSEILSQLITELEARSLLRCILVFPNIAVPAVCLHLKNKREMIVQRRASDPCVCLEGTNASPSDGNRRPLMV